MKRKIWKSIGAIILLLMFHVDAMATDYPFEGVTITINDGIAEVSLSSSGELSNNINWPGYISNLPWNQVRFIKFKGYVCVYD